MTAQGHSDENSTEAALKPCAHFIPVQKADLVASLAEQGMSADQLSHFHTLCSFLGSYFHHDFYDELTELKDIYAWFAPNMPKPTRKPTMTVEKAYARLIAIFESVMARANFVEMPREEVEALGGEHPLLDVKTRAPMDRYESLRIFYRGTHTEAFDKPTVFGLASKQVELEALDDVVVFVRFTQDVNQRRSFLQRKSEFPGGAKPGSVLIKSFRNISRAELPMLLPDVKVVMSRKDALLLGGPALLGGVPLALNILPALSVVLVVIGAYLGFSGQVSHDKAMKAVGALSVLVGAGAFMIRQYSNYSFRKLKYQKRLADNVYFKNVNNDVGVFETLISAAEEQETKEVILAYHALLTGGPAAHSGELDRRIEHSLKDAFDANVDFEVSDALKKLETLGFLTQKEGKIAVIPMGEALARLDTLWDRLYDFSKDQRAGAAA